VESSRGMHTENKHVCPYEWYPSLVCRELASMELSSILGLVTHACNVLNSMLRENYSSFNEVVAE
jgi:hypothetical protein